MINMPLGTLDSQVDRTLRYTDIWGYGQHTPGSGSTHLTLEGQIAAHFRAGASAKQTRDLMVDQGTRTAEAERLINDVVVKTQPHVPLHADQRLILQRTATDRALTGMVYIVRGYYGRPSNEIARAMVEWGYTTQRTQRILGAAQNNMDQWKSATREGAALGLGDIVNVYSPFGASGPTPTAFVPFGILVARTPQNEWVVDGFPGWNMWTAIESHLIADTDTRQTIRRIARNPSTHHYLGQGVTPVAGGVTIGGFGAGPAFPALAAWTATNRAELVRRFGERTRPGYWDSLVLAVYNESVSKHVLVLPHADLGATHTRVRGASETPYGQGEDGHQTPHPQLHNTPFRTDSQEDMNTTMLMLVRAGDFTDAQLRHQWRQLNFDPARTDIALRMAHATLDREARAAAPPTYGQPGWAYTPIDQAALDARTVRDMDEMGRTAEYIRGTNRATNFDPAQVDLAITRATATIATARQAAADAAHVPVYGEAGFSYRAATQAAVNARAQTLLATNSEAQARHILRGEDYSPTQIDMAFRAADPTETPEPVTETPVPAVPTTETPEPEEACPIGSSRRRLPETRPAAAPARSACVRTEQTGGYGPTHGILQEGEAPYEVPHVTDSGIPEGPKKPEQEGSGFLIIAAAGIVAVLAYKNM